MATYIHNDDDLTPLMTANNSPFPNVVSASSYLTNYDPYGAFTHTTVVGAGQVWVTANGQITGWLKFDFGEGHTYRVVEYSLSFYSGTTLTRAPKSWTLQGSNNNSDWTILDTHINVAAWTASEMRIYEVENHAVYRYYKLDITANQGDSTFLIIGELEFIGTPVIGYISGHVKENIIPITRQIYLHNRDTGALIASTTSSGAGGYFYCETTYSGAHYVVCLDDTAGLDYNDLIYGNIFPATISG